MNTSASSPVTALLALLTESSETERAPGSAGTGTALEESFAALLAGLTLPDQRASDAADPVIPDPDVGTQLHSLLRNLRSTNTQSGVTPEFSAASTHDEALLHAAIAAVATLTSESPDAGHLAGDGASGQPTRIGVPEPTSASGAAVRPDTDDPSVGITATRTTIATATTPDRSIQHTEVVDGLGREPSRPTASLVEVGTLPAEGVTSVEVGRRTPDLSTAGSTPSTPDASLRGTAGSTAPVPVPDGRHDATGLTAAPSRATTTASPSPVQAPAVEPPTGTLAKTPASGLADGQSPQPEPSRPPDDPRVALRTPTADRPASPDAPMPPTSTGEGTAAVDASAPPPADTPDVGSARTPRPGLPAAVERVMEAIADLEHAPPPRRLTLEIGEARVRVALEDGQVRMTALTDDADTRDLLDAAEAQLTDRGPDPGSDGRQDHGKSDGDRGEQGPGAAVPRRRADHGLRL